MPLVFELLLWFGLVAAIAFGARSFLKTLIKDRAEMRTVNSAVSASSDLESLKRRIEVLEAKVEERDLNIRKIRDELNFVSRMLEDKTTGPGA
ncbi:MAG TPA: hypothetical protein VFL04_02360 [Rectinemataceae bacterium]|nr:hypothetical protein [Rectinemataceae bacterium]